MGASGVAPKLEALATRSGHLAACQMARKPPAAEPVTARWSRSAMVRRVWSMCSMSSGKESGNEPVGGGAGGRGVVAVGDGAQGLVDVLDEFGEVERELAGGVGGTGLDDDDGVGGEPGGESGVAGRVLRLVAVKPVDDRVAGGARCRVGRRQVDAVGAVGGHDLAAMGLLLDEGRGLGGGTHGNQDEEKAHI